MKPDPVRTPSTRKPQTKRTRRPAPAKPTTSKIATAAAAAPQEPQPSSAQGMLEPLTKNLTSSPIDLNQAFSSLSPITASNTFKQIAALETIEPKDAVDLKRTLDLFVRLLLANPKLIEEIKTNAALMADNKRTNNTKFQVPGTNIHINLVQAAGLMNGALLTNCDLTFTHKDFNGQLFTRFDCWKDEPIAVILQSPDKAALGYQLNNDNVIIIKKAAPQNTPAALAKPQP